MEKAQEKRMHDRFEDKNSCACLIDVPESVTEETEAKVSPKEMPFLAYRFLTPEISWIETIHPET